MKGFVVLTVLLLLAGCGGDGGDNDVEMPPEDEIIELQSDPRGMRLVGITEEADTLLVPAVHVRYSASILGETVTDELFREITCSGTDLTCEGAGVALGLNDLVDLSTKVSVSEANLQSREDGFDTVSIKGNLNASDIGELSTIFTANKIPEGFGYGFWGDHGMAGLFLADGPASGQFSSIGVSFDGDVKVVIPFALGNDSGTNPGGTGGATWTGIAEAVSTRTFRRRQGTATLTIPDLSVPAVNVEVDIDGTTIDGAERTPGWPGVSLVDGHFEFGDVGQDYLEGNFYGEEHGEAYGVFDTTVFTGVFGAKRNVASEE